MDLSSAKSYNDFLLLKRGKGYSLIWLENVVYEVPNSKYRILMGRLYLDEGYDSDKERYADSKEWREFAGYAQGIRDLLLFHGGRTQEAEEEEEDIQACR